jgi:hypothetical protein
MSRLDRLAEKPVSMPEQDFSKISLAVEKIRAAGFGIQMLPGDKLLVTPRSQLSEAQVAWIGKNKLAILAYLRTLPDENVQTLQAEFGATIEKITLPVAEPEPAEPGSLLVRCFDCLHGTRALPGDELAAWRSCEMGLGSHFALKRRDCETFAKNP